MSRFALFLCIFLIFSLSENSPAQQGAAACKKTIRARILQVYDLHTKRMIRERVAVLSDKAGLDSLQRMQLSVAQPWKDLFEKGRKKVLRYATSKQFSKKQQAEFCLCIKQQLSDTHCETMIAAIADAIVEELQTVEVPLDGALSAIILEREWIEVNATAENCKTLQSGIFYHFFPAKDARITIERHGDTQTETFYTDVQHYTIIWDRFDSYRLMRQDAPDHNDTSYEILHVHPDYYIFQYHKPLSNGQRALLIGRLYRAEKRT